MILIIPALVNSILLFDYFSMAKVGNTETNPIRILAIPSANADFLSFFREKSISIYKVNRKLLSWRRINNSNVEKNTKDGYEMNKIGNTENIYD